MIKLITHTLNPEQLIQNAYSECYQKPIKFENMVKVLKHESVLEHISFHFEIKCSRVCLEQLVRHRMASFTVQSHRYSEIKPEDTHFYIPSSIECLSEELYQEWIDDCLDSYDKYAKWVDRGIKKEDARYLINKGVGINLKFSINLRSLLNFLSLRTESHAQEEIRRLAKEMQELAFDTMPNLKPHLEALVERKKH